jgi:NAD(P)-dependent dehydrogenase (short-subunit alcohol dehydrogenase family)
MVANAAIPVVKSVADTTVEEWDRIFAVNVRGTFLCYREAAAQMIAQGKGGRLIGACSISGKTGSDNAAAYASTKFAIRGLTQSAAADYGKHGITVNAYAPGCIETGFLDKFVDFHAKKDGITYEQRKRVVSSQGLRRHLVS